MNLSSLVSSNILPAGAVMPFAMNLAPSGWLWANGTAVSRTTYAALFAAIGTTFGTGDGSTTFNLPDLRGYFVRGAGTNADGAVSGTFGAKQADAYLSHTHTMGTESADHAHYVSGTTAGDNNTHTHKQYSSTGYGRGIHGVMGNYYESGTWNLSTGGAEQAHTHNFAAWTGGRNQGHTHAIVASGGAETRPKNIALLYCIKF